LKRKKDISRQKKKGKWQPIEGKRADQRCHKKKGDTKKGIPLYEWESFPAHKVSTVPYGGKEGKCSSR